MSDLREDWEDWGGWEPEPEPEPQPLGAAAGSALDQLAAAAAGLLLPSESDYPLEPFRWAGPGPLSAAGLLDQLGLPPDAPVETRELDSFFARLMTPQEWHDEGQRAAAARFAELHARIRELLSDPLVYRLGQIQIAVVIAGRDSAGETVGLRSTLIET